MFCKEQNIDEHSTTFTTVTSTQKKLYLFGDTIHRRKDTYNESFLETSGDWDSNKNILHTMTEIS